MDLDYSKLPERVQRIVDGVGAVGACCGKCRAPASLRCARCECVVHIILCSDVHQVVCIVYFVVALRRNEIAIRYGSRGVDILGLRTLPT